jgi:hypothetical protein
MQGLLSVEVLRRGSRLLICKEKSGSTFALVAPLETDLSHVRERLGL